MRGTLTEPGRNSPYRDRSVEENLDLFRRMRAGEFADGARTLRAKIDMASGNINMRDPTIYRIRKLTHQNTGDAWPIYPMYDYAHCVSDAVEGITHSLCTLEFEDHRPLYDWFLDQLDLENHAELIEPMRRAGLAGTPSRPQQIEFARGNLDYTVMSKRKLMALVNESLVDGWDDPRLPTLAGVRRRGFPPAAIRAFWERAGVTKQNSVIEFSVLEGSVREVLDASAPRRMAVLDPLKLVITNLDAGARRDRSSSPIIRRMPSSARAACRCRASSGSSATISPRFRRRDSIASCRTAKCAFAAPASCAAKRSSRTPTARSPKCAARSIRRRGTACPAPIARSKARSTGSARSTRSRPKCGFTIAFSPCRIRTTPATARATPNISTAIRSASCAAWLEPSLADAMPESNVQFERLGYFVADRHDHSRAKPVFNRTVTLRDSYAAK